MSERNKAVIRKLNDGFWGRRDVKVFDEVFADSYVDHTPLPGTVGTKEGFRVAALGFQAALSDTRATINGIVAEGDKVTWRWTLRGTMTGSFMGFPPTGKQIVLTGITLDRVVNGQIVERWSQADSLGMMQQLGAIPSQG